MAKTNPGRFFEDYTVGDGDPPCGAAHSVGR